jgi:hypothetical protein
MDQHDVLLGLHTAAGVAGLVLGGLVIWLSRERPLLDQSSAAYQWTVFVGVPDCDRALGAGLAEAVVADVPLGPPECGGDRSDPEVASATRDQSA